SSSTTSSICSSSATVRSRNWVRARGSKWCHCRKSRGSCAMSYASTEKSEIHNRKSIGFAKTVTAGPLRIAINAQLHGDGRSGGIELAVRGLVHALGMARDDDMEYIIVTHPSAPRWIDGHLGPNQRVVVHSDPFARATRPLRALRRSLRPARATLGRVRRVARSAIGSVATEKYEPAASDGFFESLGVDVVHF